jgi:hypothetical protein
MDSGNPTGRSSEVGEDAIVLENGALRVTVLPRYGGRIWSIIDREDGRERLWHNPAIPLAPAPRDAGYDDSFAGGWDDLFPSDAPGLAGPFAAPDHGEWWNEPAACTLAETADGPALTLSGAGWRTPHVWTRTLTLKGDRPVLTSSTIIRATGEVPFPYLWRVHPPLPAIHGGRIHLPVTSVLVNGEHTPGLAIGRQPWPIATTHDGHSRDLSRIPDPAESGMIALYADTLDAGWCAITGPDGAGLGLAFDPSIIDTITLFADYGGWRGGRVIIPEPGVGFPADLGGTIAGVGRHPVLRPGEELRFEITAVSLPPGPNAIAAIDRDGAVTRGDD